MELKILGDKEIREVITKTYPNEQDSVYLPIRCINLLLQRQAQLTRKETVKEVEEQRLKGKGR